MTRPKNNTQRLADARKKLEEGNLDNSFRKGELATRFISQMGGKEAFVSSIVSEFMAAHAGSMSRARILQGIIHDMESGSEGYGSLEDMTEEELHAFIEKAQIGAAQILADKANSDRLARDNSQGAAAEEAETVEGIAIPPEDAGGSEQRPGSSGDDPGNAGHGGTGPADAEAAPDGGPSPL